MTDDEAMLEDNDEDEEEDEEEEEQVRNIRTRSGIYFFRKIPPPSQGDPPFFSDMSDSQRYPVNLCMIFS